jgi:putative peptidoglycan lipid II flippase
MDRTRTELGDATTDAGTGREVAESFGVAGWTLVSRVTGLLRVIVVGATLGPTFFANIFQATNSVPNITYNLLAGSLLTTLIVPSLVGALDKKGVEEARRIAQGLVGVVIVGFCGAGLLVLAIGPLLVHLLTLGIHDHADAARGARHTWVLLLLVVPQITLYGIAAVGVAAQNARRRFALAAAAPAVENVGLIATLILVARWFGVGNGIQEVSSGQLVTLGTGATLSVVAHVSLQLFGASRAGIPLRPRWGWHDADVREICRKTVPTVGTAVLDAAWFFALIVAAGTVAGGVVALQIGFNFYNVPLALSAKAVGTVMLPRLARDSISGNFRRFRETYDAGISWAWFVAAPATVILVFLAKPIARSLAFGQMDRANGALLVAAGIGSLGAALLPAATNEFGRCACYARGNVHAPLVSCAVLVAITLLGIPIAVNAFEGAGAIAALGLVNGIGQLSRCVIVDSAARRDTPHNADWWRPLVRHAGIALLTIGVAAAAARLLISGDSRIGALVQVMLGGGLGLVGYVLLQSALRAPELPNALRRGPPARALVAGRSPS